MNTEHELLKLLSDGNLHSGQELADLMGISRTAVWKHLNKIRSKYLEISTVKGKGYQLERPIELLHEDSIRRKIRKDINRHLHSIQVLYETESTNNLLLDLYPAHGRVVIAEYQHAGKGRGENVWLSGLAGSLCLSIGWHYEAIPGDYNAISLATGVVVAKCLEKITGNSMQLKWPNDLIYDRCKLGGILIESRGQHAGVVDLVIGVGINFSLPEQLLRKINQSVIDISRLSDRSFSRNEIAAEIINELINLLSVFPDRGFNHYIEDWRRRDIGKGCDAELLLPGKKISGQILDIDENGNLIMSNNNKLLKFSSGELSLRLIN